MCLVKDQILAVSRSVILVVKLVNCGKRNEVFCKLCLKKMIMSHQGNTTNTYDGPFTVQRLELKAKEKGEKTKIKSMQPP